MSMDACLYVHVHVCTHACTHVCIFLHFSTSLRTHVCVCECVHLQQQPCARTFIETHSPEVYSTTLMRGACIPTSLASFDPNTSSATREEPLSTYIVSRTRTNTTPDAPSSLVQASVASSHSTFLTADMICGGLVAGILIRTLRERSRSVLAAFCCY
jgi:hypothetical protein